MIILMTCILGLGYGLLRKDGRPASILKKHFRFWPMLFLFLGLEWLLSAVLIQQNANTPADSQTLRVILVILQYGLLLAFLIRNWKKPGMIGLMTGSFLNGLVIVVNSGRMPIGQAIWRFGEEAVIRSGSAPGYFLAQGGEPLSFLGDNVPFWTFGWDMISIGDIIMAISIFFLGSYLPRRLVRPRKPRKTHAILS
jgi:hypothetical protein